MASWIVWHSDPAPGLPHAFPVPNLAGLPIQDIPQAVDELETGAARLARDARVGAL